MSIYNPWCDPRTRVAGLQHWINGACNPRANSGIRMPTSFDYVPLREGVARRAVANCPCGARLRARRRERVRLVAVSKTFPAEAVRAVHALGQRDFGENYVQEGVAKMADLADLTDIAWHLDRAVAEQQGARPPPHPFAWVQTVDREKIARSACRRRVPQALRRSTSASRSTPAAKHRRAASRRPRPSVSARTVAALPGLRLRGIMGIPEPTPDDGVAPARSSACCASASTPAAPPALPSTRCRWGCRPISRTRSPRARRSCAWAPRSSARATRVSPQRMTTTFIGGGNMATALIGGMLARGAAAARFPGGRAVRRRARHGSRRSLPASRCIDACTREAIAGRGARRPRGEAAADAGGRAGARAASRPSCRRRWCCRSPPAYGSPDLARWLAGTSGSSGPSRTLRRSSARASRARSPRRRSMPQAAPLVSSVLAAAGEQIWVDDEAMLDAVTAVSGSGPAYVFYFLEALEAAARESGLRPGGGAPARLRRRSAEPSRSAQASDGGARDAARPGHVEGRHDRARDRRRWKRRRSRRKSSRR